LPVWQELRAVLRPKGLEIVTVALDSGGATAARPWIEAAKADHPSLIDERHLCDELLGIVNVPSGVWIDETGTIVPPPEPAWTLAGADRERFYATDWLTEVKRLGAESYYPPLEL